MKHTIIALAALLFTQSALADTYVQGYTRKDGTYVPGHYRSALDANRYNNRNSQNRGGTQRDEFSADRATNKRNPAYGIYDNDRDGLSNSNDPKPESSCNYPPC